MRSILSKFFAPAALLFVAHAPASAQDQESRPAFEALTAEVQLLVAQWLSRDCGSDDRFVLENQLQAVGPELEPVFWEAYRLGPPSRDLSRDEAAIRQRYEARRKWLAEGNGDELFGAEEAERLAGLDGEEYARRELDRIRTGYATAAILGLALVATEDGSAEELDRLAADPESAYAVAAGIALKAISERAEPR